MANENNNCGCRKPRKISKGLMSRVAKFIRDKSVDGICVKSIEEIADEMGLLLPSILVDVLEQLDEKGTIKIKHRGEQLSDLSTFVYIGDDEVTKLMSTTVLLGQELEQTLGDNEEFRKYKEKVNEMINLLEQYAKEAQEFQAFKDGVVRQIEAQDNVYHIISKTKLKLDYK
ncbi:hypothetical protein Desca_1971 [Desulfotomaculum nigrificans CO-1-SRB]|uniref:Uncharacterized protein n=1 Tax=Desulfotomaculum nigrificans (strain DSM 14880 / VKM B-2319 / CO-1-SRB) TaxID=868595 RepID=F6B940_DESCC|nr:hypothetical protein [Desulfotomaculum nigrificans]AEF94812.1 hypothetical protein Desca_1971 [Desulfotomaculum nigrificans CO-1-SRB]